MKKRNRFPPGWDEQRVRAVLERYETQTEEEAVASSSATASSSVLERYETQTEEEAVAEDEAAYEDAAQTFMEVPKELVPKVRELIAKHSG